MQRENRILSQTTVLVILDKNAFIRSWKLYVKQHNNNIKPPSTKRNYLPTIYIKKNKMQIL